MQKSLSFSKGITTTPSDLLADDTELTESVGLIFRDGEMHPIQSGVKIGEAENKIVFVHRGNGYTNLIALGEGDTLIVYRYADGALANVGSYDCPAAPTAIGAVGNTLIVSTENGMAYLRYVGGTYQNLGKMPEPQYQATLSPVEADTGVLIKFSDYLLHEECKAYYAEDNSLCKIEEISLKGSAIVTSTTQITSAEAVDEKTVTYLAYATVGGKATDLSSAAQAVVADAYKKAQKKKCFAFPFFARFALRLYDGTYARISPPILCLPSIRTNGTLYPYGRQATNSSLVNTAVASAFYSDLNIFELACYFYIDNMQAWSDIIKDVVVFATPEVLPYDIDGTWKMEQPSEIMKKATWEACVGAVYYSKRWSYAIVGSSSAGVQTDGPLSSAIVPEKTKSDAEIMERLNSGMTFYKLFEVALSDSTRGVLLKTTECVKDGVVENLTSQEQLGVDDYYGWTEKKAEGMIEYNSRVQMYGVSRWPFRGFKYVQAASSGLPFTAYVHIVAPTMDAWVLSECATTELALSSWYYYPDPNATEAVFIKNGHTYRLKMKAHPRLNGAYAMERLPDGTYGARADSVIVPTVDAAAHEDLTFQIFTSVVNNPFVFEASGDNTVGTGRIIGIAANTEPISQGQFGQYPLIVFTTEGVYAMAVSSEGLYSASYPISREVCSNAKSITPTGKLVFFTSAKGLMAVSGGTVTCVSTQLRGRNPSQFVTVGDGNFLNFLDHSLLAYDYRDSLLHILSTQEEYEYVYSITDGTFGKALHGARTIAVANAYPDNIVQMEGGEILSFMAKADINEDTRRYSATLTTRPLKLASSLMLKTIHRVVHLMDSENGELALKIYASNDCRHWCELKSLHGKPWKYYRLSYSMHDMLAVDTFAGSVIDFQQLLPDKIR